MSKTYKEFVTEQSNVSDDHEAHKRIEHTSRKAFEKQAKEHGYHISSVGKRNFHHLRAVESVPNTLMVHIRGEFKPDREGLKIKDSGKGHLHIKNKE